MNDADDYADYPDHPDFKLGLLPPTPAMPALRLADYLTGVLPAHPPAADYLSGTAFGLYANDRFGVCGPTAVANSRREITARLKGAVAAPSQNDVFDLYRRSGNPGFDPATGAGDNGVNVQAMLKAVLAGGIGGVKCLGFARLDAASVEELKAAVALFGFQILGVDLQAAQQQQTGAGVWDYRRSGAWGGHAVLAGAYQADPEGVDVITWARQVRMTDAFVKNQLSEAWVVIWPEHLSDAGFLAGVDLATLAADFRDLTGRPFPAPVPPPAPPPPGPGPAPPPAQAGVLTVDTAARRVFLPPGWTAAPSRSDFNLG